MAKLNSKQLRDFIKSHEMRYFVAYDEHSGQTRIKKAFKVEINNEEYWVNFSSGDRTTIKDERCLLKTIAKANAEAQKLRDAHQRKKKEADDKRKEMFECVINFLNNFSWYNYYKNWNTGELKPEIQPFADAIREVYLSMPERERYDEQRYIKLLENYIKTGTIYTQGISFHKEHVVSVKYGEDGAVEIELTNGTTIIPKSESVTQLIKTIFGGRLDSWSYNNVKMPDTKFDKIKE